MHHQGTEKKREWTQYPVAHFISHRTSISKIPLAQEKFKYLRELSLKHFLSSCLKIETQYRRTVKYRTSKLTYLLAALDCWWLIKFQKHEPTICPKEKNRILLKAKVCRFDASCMFYWQDTRTSERIFYSSLHWSICRSRSLSQLVHLDVDYHKISNFDSPIFGHWPTANCHFRRNRRSTNSSPKAFFPIF